jgi:hypothetical protein
MGWNRTTLLNADTLPPVEYPNLCLERMGIVTASRCKIEFDLDVAGRPSTNALSLNPG